MTGFESYLDCASRIKMIQRARKANPKPVPLNLPTSSANQREGGIWGGLVVDGALAGDVLEATALIAEAT